MTDVNSKNCFFKLPASQNLLTGLGPMVLIVLFGFTAVGAPLPALSLYVHDQLGFSALTVGWVVGIPSAVTVLTRHWAGTLSDRRGPRWAVMVGLPLAASAGAFYLASAWLPVSAYGKLAVLLVGRMLLGAAESLFLTGTMSWAIGRVGATRTGLVMSWQGIAMYSAIGLGAPLGLAVLSLAGFMGIGVLTIATPLAAWLIAWPLAGVAAGSAVRVPFYRVLSLIWLPGLILALATVPFAGLAAFLPLAYAAQGWSGAGLAITAFGCGYIAVRLFGSHLPDRFGATLVVGLSLIIEAVGQIMLWLAGAPEYALIGATLSGVGFSLVFPAMGVIATQRVPADQRGRAVGNFIAFFDIAVGLTGPLVGLATMKFGYTSSSLIGGCATILALILVTIPLRRIRAAA